ncbi:hotdog fold thioesterase [Ichthyobacterium seriolicida]|nr:hotdog fold thioesterase [Ichthyobacterium seriolicida]
MSNFNKIEYLKFLNKHCENTLMEVLNIKYIDVGDNFLIAEMPVDKRVHQPMGFLHGGATMALAESVASAASFAFINMEKQMIKGISINGTHIKSIREGKVLARANAIHIGRSTHTFEILVTDEKGALISHCKCTNMILNQ